MTTGVTFDRESAGMIAETVRRSWPRGHVPRPIGAPNHAYRPPICGILLEALDPAEHPLTGAAWAWGAVFAIDPNEPPTDSEPRKLQRTTRRERIVNRVVVQSAAKGSFFVAHWINAEWLAVVLDCAAACSSVCDWTWVGDTVSGAWQQDSLSGCTGDCVCVEPAEDGTADGDTDTTSCVDPQVEEFESE